MKTCFNSIGRGANSSAVNTSLAAPAVAGLLTFFILLTWLMLAPAKAHANTITAEVLQVQCGHYLVKTPSDYAVARWYGGAKVGVKDVLGGQLNGFGMHTLKSVTADADTTAYVENYGLSKAVAQKLLSDQCA